jgi:hypothetical protein
MKRLIAATVIMLSSCTAYADYAQTKICINVGTIAADSRKQVVDGKMTEREVVDKIILQGAPVDNFKAIMLAAFAQTDNSILTTHRDWYMAGGETCLKIMRVVNQYDVHSPMVMHEAKGFYSYKGW